jgi:hypothetical protein
MRGLVLLKRLDGLEISAQRRRPNVNIITMQKVNGAYERQSVDY